MPAPSQPSAPLTLAARRRITEAVTRFDRACRTGSRPRIEDLLGGDAETGERRELLRALLEVELFYRTQAGEAIHLDDYCARFSEQTDLVHEVFAAQADDAARPSGEEPWPHTVGPQGVAPEPAGTDRNLLFAVLALQADLIDREQFVQACTLWASRKDRPLAALLVEQGWLSAEDCADVERLLARKLKRHHGDAHASLAEAAGIAERRALASVGDAEVERSLSGLAGLEGPVLEASDDRAGRHLLFEAIGQVGMGVVRRGHDPELRRDLAVKLLLPEYRGNTGLDRRFVEEAQVGGQLQHPGIVPVYEMGRTAEGLPFFTMKLIKGQTLASLLDGRSDPAQDLSRYLGIFEQVCQALAYAHSRGVIHRDLKPRNVMVGAFGEVQVMDWGLAKVLGRRDPEGTLVGTVISTNRTAPSDSTGPGEGRTGVVGTPEYMAPEQARAEEDQVDERADVFGLGGILCVILTGQPPHAARDRDDALWRAAAGDLSEAFSRLESWPAEAELVALARACLAPRRQDRPRHAGEVAQRLAAYLAGVQERLRKAELQRAAAEARAEEEAQTRRVAEAKATVERRARRLTASLAAVLLLAGSAAAWWLGEHWRSQSEANDRVRRALHRGEVLLETGWDQLDLTILQEARIEIDKVHQDALRQDAETKAAIDAFLSKADTRRQQAKENLAQFEVLIEPRSLRGYRWEVEAEPGLRSLIAQHPKNSELYFYLGWALGDQGKLAASESAYCQAINLKPEYAVAWNNLGIRLRQQGKWREAEGAYRRATDLKPGYTLAWSNLGSLLRRQKKWKGAEKAYRKAVEIKPDYDWAHYYLASTLTDQARFKEALESLEKCQALVPKGGDRWSDVRAQIDRCRRLMELQKGTEKVPGATPRDFPELCMFTKRYAAAAGAFSAMLSPPSGRPKTLAVIRYDAACCAALAGCGKGPDVDQVDDKARTRWRQQALKWLRDNLEQRKQSLTDGGIWARNDCQEELRHWKSDGDLAGVRDPQLLDRLNDNERKDWRQFWEEVEALLLKVAPKI